MWGIYQPIKLYATLQTRSETDNQLTMAKYSHRHIIASIYSQSLPHLQIQQMQLDWLLFRQSTKSTSRYSHA